LVTRCSWIGGKDPRPDWIGYADLEWHLAQVDDRVVSNQ